MKLSKLFAVAALVLSINASGQTYNITNMYLVKNGSPRPCSGKIEIKDSFISISLYGTDTSVSKYKIVRIEGGTYFINQSRAYVFTESSNRAERKEGVFYVESANNINDPNRKSMYFRVVKVE